MSEELQFVYTVPTHCSRDIQTMYVWSQEMIRASSECTPTELRAAWEWFKCLGEAKVREAESKEHKA